nr:uncharacterized protein LOC109191868 [Ipomoea batatas]
MSRNRTSMGFDANWSLNEQNEPLESYQQMVFDAAGQNLIARNVGEEPNVEDKKFFDMLDAADRQLWSGCEKLTQLSAVARLLNIKTEYRLPEQCFDAFCQLFKDGLPEDNNMVDSFYHTKKLIQGLGLPVEKIDCCRLGCMLYWGDDKELTQCKFCQQPRYKKSSGFSNQSLVSYKKMYYLPLAPRLKRLYASKTTAASMRWHNEDHGHDSGVMCHPSDSEAWKHFNAIHPSFASESRNVRLGLCTDGFQPFGQSGQQYSCWPIIITPYNLPPSMWSTPHVKVAAQLEQVATQREVFTGTGEQVDDNQLYYDVVGGHDKKRRIYGLGSYGCSIVNGSSSDNTSGNMTPTSRPPDNATSASVQDEIQSLKATILLMQQRLDAIDGGRAGTSSSPPSQTD